MIDFSNLLKKRSELIESITNEDIKKLKSLLTTNDEIQTDLKYFNLNFVDKDGQTPLHRSCENGNLNIVKLLVQNGSSQNIKNKDGWYPIHLASFHGHLDVVKFLVNEKNFSQESIIDVYDESIEINESKCLKALNYFENSNKYLYRWENVRQEEDDDDEEEEEEEDEDSSEEDSSSSSSDQSDDESSNYNQDHQKSDSEQNDISFYLNNLNLDELKMLDNLNDLFNLSADLFIKL